MEQFDCEVTIQRRRFANVDTGWAVVDASLADGTGVVLVGAIAHLEERERAQVQGVWEESRYGPQVKVAQALALAPTDRAAVLAYLRRVPGIGERRAQALIERHGADGAIAAIDADTEGVLAGAGLGQAAMAKAAAGWERLRVTRQLHLLLAPHGLAHLVAAVQAELGDGAHRIVRAQPYSLTRVFGVGFAIADRIARGQGAALDSPERARAAVRHVLAEAERAGSNWLPEPELARRLTELLGSEPPSEIVETLVADGELERDDVWIYRRETAALERELAERVTELVRAPVAPPSKRLGRRVRARVDAPRGDIPTGDSPDGDAPEGDAPGAPGGEAPDAPGLTSEQHEAVRTALTRRLSLITGGPGTGKTATIRAIVHAAAEQGQRVLLVAPTGRAAARMRESSGVQAATVHSALGWIPGEGPTHDAEDPLRCDLLVVDETSMANLELLVTLLRALPNRAHVVLVGDADQLAPVGAGKPFAELVADGRVPTTRLTHIFRQAAGSMIVQGAHAIRRGQAPSFRRGEGMRHDLFLIERGDPVVARQEIVSLVTERLPRHYELDPVRDIQVFAPVYRGDLGIDALNVALRDALNPDGRAVKGGRLRIGDKLMMTGRNLHELGLMNGTVLTLLDEVSGRDGDHAALILAGEESVFRVPLQEADRLRPAYACSVHRGQGIELPVAVIVAHPAAGAFFLRREMLYTALTRARTATVIVGAGEVVARAARTPDTERRYSRLAARLEG